MLTAGSITVGNLLLDNAVLASSNSLDVFYSLTVANGATLNTAALTIGSPGTATLLTIDPAARMQISGAGLAGLHVYVDSTVSIAGVLELGTTGGAAAGMLTVDAGQTANISSTVTSPILDNGVITGAATLFPAAISGTGSIAVGNATFLGPVAAGITLNLFYSAITIPANGFAGVLDNWMTGGSSQFSSIPSGAVSIPRTDITAATYTPTGATSGTLNLTGAGGATLQTLSLQDNVGTQFLVLPTVSGAGITGIQVAKPSQVLAPGTSGDVALTGLASLTGALTAGNVGIGSVYGPSYPSPAGLQVQAGASLNAASLTIPFGLLAVGAGATVTSAGTLTLSQFYGTGFQNFGEPASLLFTRGGSGEFAATLYLRSNAAVVAVDSASRLEIGPDGTAALGGLTIDRTIPVIGTGTIDAAVTNNGSLIASATITPTKYQPVIPSALIVNGALTGTGEDQIAANSTLTLNGSAGAGQTIEFIGASGTLDLRGAGTIQASLTGFAPGDAILASAAVARASYAAGILTLSNLTGATVQTLAATGGFAGNTLLVRAAAGGGSAVLLSPGTLLLGPAPAPSPGLGGQSLVWSGTTGDFGTAANWRQIGSNTPPPAAPGGGGSATIDILQSGVITGAATVTSLLLRSNTVLSGTFTASNLLQELQYGDFTDTVAQGATLVAAAATLESRFVVSGPGAAFAVGGLLQVYTIGRSIFGIGNPNPPEIDVRDHAAVSIGGIAGATLVVQLDATSYFEVGFAGLGTAGVLTVDPGAIAAGLTTDAPIGNFGTIMNAGTITDAVLNNATIAGGGSFTGPIAGTGHIQAASGTPMSLGQVGAGQTLDFLGPNAAIALAVGSTPALITGFAASDVLALTGTPVDTATYAPTAPGLGRLTLSRDGAAVQTLQLSGNFAGAIFIANPDRTNGTDIVLVPGGAAVACYAAGTRIRTDRGDVPVELLRIGDRVVSAFGGTAPLVWLGQRRTDCARHPRPHTVWPIRIRAGAFGDGIPARDLRLSPDHAVHVDGYLIPIACLANGRSIVQQPVEAITYVHVELPAHDVIFAESLPAESYLDTGNRSAFAGPAQHLHPDFAQRVWQAEACAPQLRHGPILDAIRARLAQHLAVPERSCATC